MNSFGVYGVGVMGRGLALNLAAKGHRISIYNKEVERITEVVDDAHRENIHTVLGYNTVKEFVQSLKPPRKILMMVPAGRPVCDVIASMTPYLKRGDILIDGGNEWYQQTQRRQEMLRWTYNVELIGMGVSGGAHGARYGAAFMPGGDRAAVEAVLPFLRDASDPRSEVAYVGAGGSGNFVKMVHNGIEYAVMQAISEVYGVLKMTYGMTNDEIATFFEECDRHYGLESYLLDITARILRKRDDSDGDDTYLVDKIIDVPHMNGTGAWTAKEVFDTLVSCPTIIAAIDARLVARDKPLRTRLAAAVAGSHAKLPPGCVVDSIGYVLVATMRMAYLQGFELIRAKSDKEGWGVDISSLARNWMGGCIIRSTILDMFKDNDDMDPARFFDSVDVPRFAMFVSSCVLSGAYIPVISATYQYIIGYTSAEMPAANLIQAQRDCFGSHGYERRDKPGKFHTEW